MIGSEFAFLYQTFGAEVTMVEMLPRALSTEDVDIAGIIECEFKRTGIRLLTNVKNEIISEKNQTAL